MRSLLLALSLVVCFTMSGKAQCIDCAAVTTTTTTTEVVSVATVTPRAYAAEHVVLGSRVVNVVRTLPRIQIRVVRMRRAF